MVSKFTFFCTIGSSRIEVFPLNFLNTSLIDELETNQIFYRRKFNGTLIFNNSQGDFDILASAFTVDPCQSILLEILCDSAFYWSGYFSDREGETDYDKCIFELELFLPIDDYSDLLDKAKIQHSILDQPPITTRAIEGKLDVTFTRSRLLKDAIDYLAIFLKYTAVVSSHFFNDATNYVTLNPNHLRYLTIAQKSDIIRAGSSTPAQSGMMSWSELMDILWSMFQVCWNYDPVGNIINLEHISWFTPVNLGLDLRSMPISKAGNVYSYNKDKMPKYEKFSFMEANNADFVGTPIWYDDSCVNQDPGTNSKETSIKVTTDLDYIINSPGAIADEGWVILCNRLSGGNYFVELNPGSYHNDVRLNMHLSWANLQDCYFRHNRVLIEGRLNGRPTVFWSAQKTIKQDPINAIVCPADNFNPADLITTELGETYFSGEKGAVEKSELFPNGLMKLNLLYGPPENENTGIADRKWCLIWENGAGHFQALFSEAPTTDYTFSIVHIIYDSTGSIVCTGATQYRTIDHDNPDNPFDVTLCDSVPASGWIWYPLFRSIDMENDGWIISILYDPDFMEYG